MSRYQDWEFFAETDDPEYTAFWANFNGTTEYNPADDVLRVKAYRRRILDPSLAEHRRFIRTQSDGTPYIRDSQGMVTQIELISGEKCNRRVCCHCHNPLPDNYGKNNVKFASVIGITGAGKTVYLSQLLRRMRSYSVKVGLNAIVNNTGVRTFLEKNSIAANTPLPGSTPAQQFQQPLFYEMVRDAQDHGRITETFVLYDVAGEVFKDPALIIKFAPFIEHRLNYRFIRLGQAHSNRNLTFLLHIGTRLRDNIMNGLQYRSWFNQSLPIGTSSADDLKLHWID